MVTRFTIIFLMLSLIACSGKKDKIDLPVLPRYDLTKPVIIHLRSDLEEISGLSYYPKDTSVFAINDEQGILFKIYLRKEIQIKKWQFSFDADYEDVLLVDSTFYALQSNGDLTGFTFKNDKPDYLEKYKFPVEGRNEFESLYYDEDSEKLVIICKDCESDTKKIISAYTFDPKERAFSKKAFYAIDADRVKDLMHNSNAKFKASAAAVHPLTKELYVLSSTTNSMMVTDKKGDIKGIYYLDTKIFKQPEGITFTPSGDMLISNEGADIGAGNILIYKYKPLINEKG